MARKRRRTRRRRAGARVATLGEQIKLRAAEKGLGKDADVFDPKKLIAMSRAKQLKELDERTSGRKAWRASTGGRRRRTRRRRRKSRTRRRRRRTKRRRRR